jgi:hypothetical protein
MQAQVQCPTCRTMNPPGKVFCISCRNALMGGPATQPISGQQPSKALVPPPSPPQPQPQAQYPQSQPYQPTQPYNPQSATPSYMPQSQQQGMQPYTPAQISPYQQPASPYSPPSPSSAYPVSQPQPQPQYNPYSVQPDPRGGQSSTSYNVQQTYVMVAPPPTQPYVQPYVPAQPKGRGGPILWFLWVLATTIGWAIALPLGSYLFDTVGKSLYTPIFTNTISNSSTIFMNLILLGAIFSAVVGIAIGLITGLAQWIALAARGYTMGTWPLVGMIAWPLGIFIAWVVLLFLFMTPSGAPSALSANISTGLTSGNPLPTILYLAAIVGGIIGLVVGFAQWTILSGRSSRAGLWILASPIAGAITACALAWILTTQATQGTFLVNLQGNLLLTTAVYAAIIGAIEGTTRGAALTAIL